jgi:serine/threonine-protein phosphatase 6 regulatory ankyrin repeat subunit B
MVIGTERQGNNLNRKKTMKKILFWPGVAVLLICMPVMASDIAEAGMFGKTRVLEKAIEKGESLESRDEDGSTALNNAVTYGHYKSAKLLLEHGAKIDTRDNEGDTPLHNLAVFRNRQDPQIGALLLSKNADLNARDNDGYTPFQLAVTLGRTSLVKLYLEHSVGRQAMSPLQLKDADGSTVLGEAVSLGRLEMVKLLLTHGASVNTRDNEGNALCIC